MATATKAYQVLYDYSDVPTLKKFTLSDLRVRCAMGPFGCLRGDQLIITSEGLVPISLVTPQTLVLSWSEKPKEFLFASGSGAFPKGRDFLYRIVTQRGEFVAASHHRVLGADGKYRQVSELHQGDVLPLCSIDRLRKLISEVPLSFRGDGRHFSEKVSDWMVHYVRSAHRYGQRLLQEANIFPAYVPLRDDVRILSSYPYMDVYGHMDDCAAQLLLHNHQGQPFYHTHTCDCYGRLEPRNEGAQGYAFLRPFSHISEKALPIAQSLLTNVLRYTRKLFFEYFRSFKTSSLSDGAILSIERLNVKETFWDMQIPGTNNYVTADGTIHHNSGKSSACVMEIVRRAHAQAPGPDGIRRSRWAVVRNSYGQLKDTTIRTFHDWFPPKIFGEYRVTDHMYIITKFPGVHIEILFRALDRPDQVSNLLSLEVTGAWFNEVREIPKTIIEAMDARIGRYPSKRDGGPSWFGIIMDTNPPDEDSYLYKMFEVVRPDNWKIFKQPSGLSTHAENTKHLPKGYYTNLAKGKDEMYKRIYIDGQYGYLVSGKPVFASFVDNVHVAPNVLEPQKGLDVIIGFDFGLQPACSIGQITPFGQLRILDELVSDGMGLRQFCENQLLPLLRRKYFGMSVMGFGDPSGTSRMPTDESTCFEVLQSREIGLSDVVPAPTNAIMPRVSSVEHFLNKMYAGEPGFVLSPNCHFLRKALNGAYHYEREPKSLGEDYKPMPVKNFASHISDSLQMLCLYIQDKEEHNKRWKALQGQLKRRQIPRVADRIAGY